MSIASRTALLISVALAACTERPAGEAADPVTYIDDWQGSGVQGTLVYWKDVASNFLARPRHVGIWLPPGYDAAA